MIGECWRPLGEIPEELLSRPANPYSVTSGDDLTLRWKDTTRRADQTRIERASSDAGPWTFEGDVSHWTQEYTRDFDGIYVFRVRSEDVETGTVSPWSLVFVGGSPTGRNIIWTVPQSATAWTAPEADPLDWTLDTMPPSWKLPETTLEFTMVGGTLSWKVL